MGGDNQAGLRILEAPDGPWRTRHLRLRAHALRERVKWGAWKVIHIPGQHLVADFLTKPIGVAARWQHFFAAMGMKPVVEAVSESLGSKVARIAALVGGLAGVMAWRPSGSTGKAAQSLAVAAMVASLATSWRAGCDSKKRATGPIRDEYADPPYGLQDQVREDEPTCSREDGSEEEPISEPSPEGSRDLCGRCEPWRQLEEGTIGCSEGGIVNRARRDIVDDDWRGSSCGLRSTLDVEEVHYAFEGSRSMGPTSRGMVGQTSSEAEDETIPSNSSTHTYGL